MTVSMTVRMFGTEVDSRLLVLLGATIVVAAAAAMMYFRDQESYVMPPLWSIIATAVVAIVAVAGWHRWTRRRQMQRGDALGFDGAGPALGLLSDLSDGGEDSLRLRDPQSRSSTRRDVGADVDSLFNLSESFMTVQSFPKVRGHL